LVFVVRDAEGAPVRKLYKKASKGVNRVNWDLRYSSPQPIRASSGRGRGGSGSGMLAMPGAYSVEMYMVSREGVEQLVEAVDFNAVLLNQFSLPVKDREALIAFQKEVSELSRVMMGTGSLISEQEKKLEAMHKAIKQTPGSGKDIFEQILALEAELEEINFILSGPEAKASWEELPPMDMPLNRRLYAMAYTHWNSTAELTKTETDQLEILKQEFPPVLERVQKVVEQVKELDSKLEEMKAPWTPGRIPSL
jgi:hypothetical protein